LTGGRPAAADEGSDRAVSHPLLVARARRRVRCVRPNTSWSACCGCLHPEFRGWPTNWSRSDMTSSCSRVAIRKPRLTWRDVGRRQPRPRRVSLAFHLLLGRVYDDKDVQRPHNVGDRAAVAKRPGQFQLLPFRLTGTHFKGEPFRSPRHFVGRKETS
jgi:hypothetical protein